MSEWKEYKLGELCTITSSKRIFLSEYVPFGVPFYRSKEIIEKSKGNDISTELFITNEKFCDIKNKFGIPLEDDILLTSVGTLGVSYQVRKKDHFYFKDGNLTWFKDFSKIINPRFLLYWLRSEYGKEAFNRITIGSTQAALTIQGLKGIDLTIPSLPTQTAIAEILSSLDDKIELNNQINKDLEALAQALFKQWFIDFDFPNENGGPYRSSGGEMVDSELGEIPKGWKTDRLGDHLYVKGRIGWKGLKKSDYLTYNTGYSIINGSDFSNEQIDWRKCGWISMERYEESPEIMLKEDDILITKDGTIGKIAFVNKLYSSTSVASGIFVVRVSSESLRTYFCWSFFKSPYFQELVKSRIDGSVIPHLYQRDFVEMFIPLPPVELLDKFENQSKLIFQNIFQNKEEAKDLEKLRDTLLPKLISGELKVTNNSIEV